MLHLQEHCITHIFSSKKAPNNCMSQPHTLHKTALMQIYTIYETINSFPYYIEINRKVRDSNPSPKVWKHVLQTCAFDHSANLPKFRKIRDSNPRPAFDGYTCSRRAPSTTRPIFQKKKYKLFIPIFQEKQKSKTLTFIKKRI